MPSVWRCAVLLVVLAAGGCRPVVLGRAEGILPGGAYLRVARQAAPSSAVAFFSGFGGSTYLAEGRRYYTEPKSLAYSGYEVRARDLGNGQFAVYFLRLGAPPHEGPYRPAPLAQLPRPTVLRESEPFEIDLARGPAGQRLYDRLILYRRRPDL